MKSIANRYVHQLICIVLLFSQAVFTISWRQLREVSADMKRWSFETFGSVRAEIKKLRSQLESAKENARLLGTSQEVRELEKSF
jgi:hypothetical protein